MQRFKAVLEPVPHGGHYVVVPGRAAEKEGLRHSARVRGEVNGVPFRSSLMKYSGIFHLGIHKATLEKANAKPGQRVEVTLELDDAPLPTDVVPPDLEKALARNKKARDAFAVLRPSHRREYVKHILEAKKEETRARRVQKTLEALTAER